MGSETPDWLSPAPLTQPSPVNECRTLLTFKFLMLGPAVALPLLSEVWTTACLFHHHECERQQARLPPERGLEAAFYRAVHSLLGNGRDGCSGLLPLLVCGYLLLVVAWDASIWLAYRPQHLG